MMKQYHCLMEQIRDEFGIIQGETEADADYKSRLVYSVLGRMAYASLSDIQEDMKPASIVHFKRRISAILTSYIEMYPELTGYLPLHSEDLASEIYQAFLNSGCIYHAARRILPSAAIAARVNNLYLTRGIALETHQSISGLGTYTTNIGNVPIVSAAEMFQLQDMSLYNLWQSILRNARWAPFQLDTRMEYLKTFPPYKSGYWVEQPDRRNCVSLMRTKSETEHLYYLYRWENSHFTASPIPDWMVSQHRYRTLSNACLFNLKTLPAAQYKHDGDIIYLHLEYLYPPAELNLIRLYSWPMKYWNFPSDFLRIFSEEVFFAIRKILEPLGYQFIEE